MNIFRYYANGRAFTIQYLMADFVRDEGRDFLKLRRRRVRRLDDQAGLSTSNLKQEF